MCQFRALLTVLGVPKSPSGLAIVQKDLQDSAYSHIHGSDLLQKRMQNKIGSKKAHEAKPRGSKLFRHKFSKVLIQWSHTGRASFSIELWQYMWSVVYQGSSLETLEACAGFPCFTHASFSFAEFTVSFHWERPYVNLQTWGGLGDLQHTSQGPALQAGLSEVLRIAVWGLPC